MKSQSITELIIEKNYDRLKQMLVPSTVNAKNIHGDTFFHTHMKHCIRQEDSAHPLTLTDIKLIILLLKSGGDPDILDNCGITGRKYLEKLGYTIHGHALRIRTA